MNVFIEDPQLGAAFDWAKTLSHPKLEVTLSTDKEKRSYALEYLSHYLKDNHNLLLKIKKNPNFFCLLV